MSEDDYPYVTPAGVWKLLEHILPYDLARIVMNCAWPNWIVTRVLMPKTTVLVRAHLPKNITELVMDMFQRVDDNQSCPGFNGEYEAAMCLPSCMLDNAFIWACYNGYREMYDMLISRGVNDWYHGIEFGCCGGQIEIVKDLIPRELSTYIFVDPRYWKRPFHRACVSGNVEMIKLIEPYTRNGQFLIDMYNNGLESVCYCRSIKAIDYLISLGANNLNRCFGEACRLKRSEIMKHLILRGATHCNYCDVPTSCHL